MNKIGKILGIGLAVANLGCAAHEPALDPVFVQLKTAIDQGKPVEKLQSIWDTIVANGISQQKSTDLINQVVTYAQEQKAALETQKTTMGSRNYSLISVGLIKGGIGATVFNHAPLLATYLKMGLFRYACKTYFDGGYSYDGIGISDTIWMDVNTLCIPIPLTLMISGIALLGFGARNIIQGVNFRKNLEIKIDYLAKIIEYLQSLAHPSLQTA